MPCAPWGSTRWSADRSAHPRPDDQPADPRLCRGNGCAARGGLVAVHYGGVSPDVFLQRLQASIGMNTFLVGLIKAPFMALVIGLIACLEGLKVEGSAESLGRHTTASVVKSIFIVIVVDGLFAMFFAAIRY